MFLKKKHEDMVPKTMFRTLIIAFTSAIAADQSYWKIGIFEFKKIIKALKKLLM